MDLKKIEGLIKIVENSKVTEFEYKDSDVKVRISKLEHPPVIASTAAAPAAVNTSPQVNVTETKENDDKEEYITSPIVGTFYSAAAPDVPAFVRVGDRVKEGQTVCILEAMKLMNEIQSDFDCEIEAVLVSNEQKVEYGQPLFRVKKL